MPLPVNAIPNTLSHEFQRATIALSQQNISAAATSDEQNDAPIEDTVFIPSGNPNETVYREMTFNSFPLAARQIVNPYDLANYGFKYTGHKDQVECFSCVRKVQGFIASNNLTVFTDWHTPDCAFKNGTDTDNIPRPSLRLSQATFSVHNRITARQTVPSENSENISVRQPAKGQNQTAQFVKTADRHPPFQLPSVIHANHEQQLSNGNLLEGNERLETAPPAFSESIKRQLVTMFPCLYPVSPNMRDVSARCETFNRGWPGNKLYATPIEIANAGFFYMGTQDKAKCWYCNGGIHNWVSTDNPWVEHAKWFPCCEFLLQNTGPAYIHNITVQFPNLRRPQARIIPPCSADVPPPKPRVTSNAQSTTIRPNDFQVATLLSALAHPNHLLFVGSSGFTLLPPGSNLKSIGYSLGQAVVTRQQAEMITALESALEPYQARFRQIFPTFDLGIAAKCIVTRYGDSQRDLIAKIIHERLHQNVTEWFINIGDTDFCKSANKKCSAHSG